MTYPHHYHRETIFTGAGWPYRCRCGEGDAIGGVRGDNCPVALREEIARLTGAVAELADVLDEADFVAQNPNPPEADRHNLRLRIMAARDAIKEQA